MKRPAEMWVVDPIFQSLPWEIHRNENGEVIAEVFLLPAWQKNDGIIRREGVKKNAANGGNRSI